MPMTYNRLFPAVVVPSGGRMLISLDTSKLTQLFAALTVAGAALTAFSIRTRPTPALFTAVTLYSTTADFTTPAGLLIGVSGDLSIQAIGVGWFLMDVSAMQSVELWATSAGSATVSLEIGGF